MSIIVQDLSKVFGKQKAVDQISFQVRPGEILGFLGPNGAGKSTTMKMATGYLSPTSGNVEICGFDVMENSLEVRKHIGYLPEHNPLYLDLYVHEYLRFIGSLHGLRSIGLKSRVAEMIHLCGLTREQNKKIGALSKGYRQRIGLAQALIHDPPVLILDEPTTGLDPNQITEIRQLIKNVCQRKAVVFSTHIMQEVQALCHRVLIINQGKIVTDSTLKELQNNGQVQASGFEIELEFARTVNEQIFLTLKEIKDIIPLSGNKYLLKTIKNKQDERLTELRHLLFSLAAKHDLPLIGLRLVNSKSDPQSLEEIFRKLTVTNS